MIIGIILYDADTINDFIVNTYQPKPPEVPSKEGTLFVLQGFLRFLIFPRYQARYQKPFFRYQIYFLFKFI